MPRQRLRPRPGEPPGTLWRNSDTARLLTLDRPCRSPRSSRRTDPTTPRRQTHVSPGPPDLKRRHPRMPQTAGIGPLRATGSALLLELLRHRRLSPPAHDGTPASEDGRPSHYHAGPRNRTREPPQAAQDKARGEDGEHDLVWSHVPHDVIASRLPSSSGPGR